MKAKAIILAVIACMMLSSCNRVETAKGEDDTSMFVKVETTTFWDVVYHKDTKVMYVVSTGSYNHGTFTLLVDENGKPLIYDAESESAGTVGTPINMEREL